MMTQVRTLVCLLLAPAAAAGGTGAHQCSAGALDCAFDTLELVQTKLHIHSEARGRARRADAEPREHMNVKPNDDNVGAAIGDARRPTFWDVMERFHRFMWVPPSKYLISALGGEMPLPRSFVARKSAPQTNCKTVMQKVLVEPYKYCFFPVILMMASLLVPFLLKEARRAHAPWQETPIKGKLLSISD